MSYPISSKSREYFKSLKAEEMNNNSSLLQLPIELFTKITECLDNQSIQAMRAACQATNKECDEAMLGSNAPMRYGRNHLKRAFDCLQRESPSKRTLPARELDFSMVDVDDELPIISIVKLANNVTSLDFWNCSKINDISLTSIVRSCKNLQKLNLTGCAIKPETIEWIKLRYPHISITKTL